MSRLRSFAQRVVPLMLAVASAAASADDLIIGTLTFETTPPAAAVLYVRDASASINEVSVDQKNRQFGQYLSVGSQNATIAFHNSDTARHNIYANSYSTGTRFDVGLVPPGQTVNLKLSWAEDSIVRVGCAIHSHMETYIAHIRASHYQVLPFKRWEEKGGMDDYGGSEFEERISKDADIRIRQVPADNTTLTLLMPYYQPLTFELKAGESKTLDVMRDGAKRGTLTVKRS